VAIGLVLACASKPLRASLRWRTCHDSSASAGIDYRSQTNLVLELEIAIAHEASAARPVGIFRKGGAAASARASGKCAALPAAIRRA